MALPTPTPQHKATRSRAFLLSGRRRYRSEAKSIAGLPALRIRSAKTPALGALGSRAREVRGFEGFGLRVYRGSGCLGGFGLRLDRRLGRSMVKLLGFRSTLVTGTVGSHAVQKRPVCKMKGRQADWQRPVVPRS